MSSLGIIKFGELLLRICLRIINGLRSYTVHQSLERVFHPISKHLKVGSKK